MRQQSAKPTALALLVCVVLLTHMPLTGAQPWTSLKEWQQALDQEYQAVEQDKQALAAECSVVWSKDTAKVAECDGKRTALLNRMAAYKKSLAAYDTRKGDVEWIDTELGKRERRIGTTRAEIAQYSARLSDYQAALDEWTQLPEDARQKARAVAIEGVFTVVLEGAALRFEHQAEATFESLKNLFSTRYQQLLPEEARRSDELRTLWIALSRDINSATNSAHITSAFSAFKDAAFALHKRHDGLSAVLNLVAVVNSLWVGNPSLALLIIGGECVIATIYVLRARTVAKQRVEALLDLGADQLRGLDALTKLYEDDIKERNKLLKQRTELLR